MPEIVLPEAPPTRVWIVCAGCNFGMECTSEMDAHEIASRHLKENHHGNVAFYYDEREYKRVMASKPLPDGSVYPQDHRKHRHPKLL